MLKLSNKTILIKTKIDKKKNISLKADPNLIDQAFNNLAHNAINSIKEKTTLVNDYKGEIIISLELKKEFCKLTMVDNGMGLQINKEFLTEPYISRSKNGQVWSSSC